MKILGFSFVAITSLLSMSSAHASTMPTDLEDLSKRWESVTKVDGSQNLMSMEFVQFDPEVDVFPLMEHSYLEAANGKKLSELQFARLKENSRNTLLEA